MVHVSYTKSCYNTSQMSHNITYNTPDGKVHGANVGPTWGWQDPGGPHVGPMNFLDAVTPVHNNNIAVTSHEWHGITNHQQLVQANNKNQSSALLAFCESNPPVSSGFPDTKGHWCR